MPEMELLTNKEWILTKNRVLEKTDLLFARLQEQQQLLLQHHPDMIPAAVIASGAKLSRGENYRGLPYRILDHPRCFGADGYFAIRSFCWWGNFFSVTLLLSGKYKTAYEDGLLNSCKELSQQDFFYCIQDDPWQHHFERDNVIPLREITYTDWKAQNEKRFFLKLAKKIPLTEWDNAVEQMLEAFELLLRSLHQLPSR